MSLAELGYRVTRELDTPISDFAVGKLPHAAVRTKDDIRVFDGQRWTELPALEAPSAELSYRLFFGRDNRPRLMGYERGQEPRAFYRRFKGGRFQPEPSELGQLAGAHGALYGVLGFPDPEVVCKPHEICLVKRLTGWTPVPAHDAPVPIFIGRGDAFALVDHTLERLAKAGFEPYLPAQHFEQPSALWVDAQGLPWVLDGSTLFRATKEAGWQRTELPFEGSALAGTPANKLWLAGDHGAALFDGTEFRCPRELSAPLSGIAEADREWWFWGPAGAFRVQRLASN